MNRVIVTKGMMDASWGLYALAYMQICAEVDATDSEILEVCNRENPSGTTNGWSRVVRTNPNNKKLEPIQCEDHPTRMHYLVAC